MRGVLCLLVVVSMMMPMVSLSAERAVIPGTSGGGPGGTSVTSRPDREEVSASFGGSAVVVQSSSDDSWWLRVIRWVYRAVTSGAVYDAVKWVLRKMPGQPPQPIGCQGWQETGCACGAAGRSYL